MDCLHIVNWYSCFGLMISSAISFTQPTLKRKIAVLCLFMAPISPLMACAFYMERHDLPGFPLWLDATVAVFTPLASILTYQWGCRWIQKIEEMKLRSAKRVAYIESLRYNGDEELF